MSKVADKRGRTKNVVGVVAIFAAMCAGALSVMPAYAEYVDSSKIPAAGIPLPEHPRPDWERSQWVNLNGQWDFGFENGAYDRKITVPFGWGCEFSGVKDEKGKNTGYYRDEERRGERGRVSGTLCGGVQHGDAAVLLGGKRAAARQDALREGFAVHLPSSAD